MADANHDVPFVSVAVFGYGIPVGVGIGFGHQLTNARLYGLYGAVVRNVCRSMCQHFAEGISAEVGGGHLFVNLCLQACGLYVELCVGIYGHDGGRHLQGAVGVRVDFAE